MSRPNFNVDLVANKKIVANEFPDASAPYSLAIIGEAPGQDEESFGRPFIGPSGSILTNLMSNAGIHRKSCFMGNICQVRPDGNQISRFRWDGPEIQDGLATLKSDLDKFQPNLCLLLGATALKAAGVDTSINSYRGTLFKCRLVDSPFFARKCMASFHPAAIMRQYSWMPLLRFDLGRAKEESHYPDLRLPKRHFVLEPSADNIIERLETIRRERPVTSIDIEGGVTGMTCCSVATSPLDGFIIAFSEHSEGDEQRIMSAFSAFCADPNVPKVLQNCLYDQFVLAYAYKIIVRGVVWDTMLSGWEINPELPKSLGVQASIYTKEPYYKSERTVGDKWVHYEYCCKDSAVTHEIASVHDKMLTSESRAHFDFNMQLLPVLLYMELRGIRYDKEKAAQKLGETKLSLNELQARIDQAAGTPLNPRSPKNSCHVLYHVLGYPAQHPKEKGKYNRNKQTSNVDAILALIKKYPHKLLFDILEHRSLDKLRSALEITTDPDGRVRCAYNAVGTETGRLTCYESPTGSGANLQTVTKKLRHLYLADDGHSFFQLDLSGADGWTVACHCAALGDGTMLADYHARIKPAKVIALLYQHGPEVNHWTSDQIKAAARDVTEEGKDGWLYFACKRVQHGTNYGLGKDTMSGQILKDSHKLLGEPIYLKPQDCVKLQDLYLSRYPGVRLWQRKVQGLLHCDGFPKMKCASGHTRLFFGRPNDHDTFKEALAQEPQANTTYATNRAMVNLWLDPENRRADNSLIIEPLHQVHDAMLGQFPTELASWAVPRLRAYFNNPLTIAGITITIPFDGGYGRSWGELTTPI